MDYSLLLGLDSSRGELVMGLVDAIGSFGLFKTLESRGKLALNRGGEVTVVRIPSSIRKRLIKGRSRQISIGRGLKAL
jgi:1-phosphatidylinositol-3-phosphate 5-kinase